MKRILVLGGSGYVGTRLCAALRQTRWATPISASSRRIGGTVESMRVDTRDPRALTLALHGIDAVVNCVAGNAQAISEGAKVLAQACAAAGCDHIVHLSSMSVYGPVEGRITEEAPLDPRLGWYGQAKCEAERHMVAFAQGGGTAVILRPGCVWGPGSELWVGRIARLLRAGRLGDLGAAGDGWSNLVHVDDVCSAIVAALRTSRPTGHVLTYNLAAPDSPRWNEYFVDLALAIGATPVRRVSPRQLRLDAWLAGPPLKTAQASLAKARLPAHAVPDPLPPGLLGLWERQLLLDSSSAQRDLDIRWTPYSATLRESAAWFLDAPKGMSMQSEKVQSGQAPERKPVLATMPGPDPLWNTYVEDCLPKDAGSLRDHLALLKLAKGREVLILCGSVGRRERYRDLIFAILLKLTSRPPRILFHDATWEPGSESLAREFPFLKRVLPKLARLAISAVDGPHVRYAVLSSKEVETFPGIWGVDPERVVFQPFPNTLHGYRTMPTRDDGYLFAGGNSLRDYGLLESALEGTGVPTRIATKWRPSLGLSHLQAAPTSHDEFMSLMANSHAVVVPLRRSVRSAGQQTYLNAMGLGKPVIVTEAPGVRDYVIDGVTGVIVPPDEEALRAAILHVMDPANADFYAQMGRRARQDVFERFTEETFRHGLLRHAGVIGPNANTAETAPGEPAIHLSSS